MWTALLLSLAPLALPPDAPDEEAWVARLHPPKLVHVDFTVNWQASLHGTDLGFPDDVDESLADAQERIDAGEGGAQVLLQASAALFSKRRVEDLKRVLPACLMAYDRELEEDPDDVLLAVGRARALSLIGRLIGDDAPLRAAHDQLEHALSTTPDDPLLAMDCLLVSFMRIVVGSQRGTLEPEWLTLAEDDARRAIELAPDETGPRFGLYQVRHNRGVISQDPDTLLEEVRIGALELLDAADVIEGEDVQELRLAGYGFLFMADALPRFMQAAGGQEIDAPEQRLVEALTVFEAGLAELPGEDALASEVLRVFWALACLVGDLDTHAQRLASVVEAGLDEELALSLATAALHLRGASDEAAAAAEALLEAAASDIGHAALASYYFKVDETHKALAQLDALSGTSGAYLGARAVALLRLGETEKALETCTQAEQFDDVEGELEADLAYARGVALALLGKYDEAERALARAADALPDDEGLAETLAEVRARK